MNELQALEQMKARSKKIRNIILLSVGGAVLLAAAVIGLLFLLLPEPEEAPEKELHFYPVDFDRNIFATGEYHDSDMVVSYCANESGMGLTEAITDENRASFDGGVQFMEAYLKTVISGDYETYRSFFTEAYLKEHNTPVFTQQMLYDMCIYACGSQTLSGGVTRATYRLEYRIRQNNGSYRNDLGSDAIRPEYVVLLIDPDGQVQIENVYTRTTVTKK